MNGGGEQRDTVARLGVCGGANGGLRTAGRAQGRTMWGMPTRPDLRLMGLLGGLAVGVALAQSVSGLGTGLLLLAPALVLLLPLLAGRYVGERTLQRWKAAFVPRRRRPAAVLLARVPRRAPRVADGGALLAAGLGRRGPPRAAPAV